MDNNNLFDAKSIEITEDVSNIDEILEYEQILLSISKSIINYRKINDLTQKQLAEMLKVRQSMVVKLERGNYNATMKLLYSISRKLTDSSELFIEMLRDMITNLYKSKNIKYNMQYNIYETYTYNNDNITYLNNIKEGYGGTFYGEVNSTSKFSATR